MNRRAPTHARGRGAKSARPDLTVIMATKGRARFVGEALDSVRRQTLRNWRMLIVHGASDDGALGILRAHARADSRIELQPERQSGYANVLNQAIAQVTTPFFILQEDDDLSHPERFAACLDAMRTHPQADAIVPHCLHFESTPRRPSGPPHSFYPTLILGCFRTASLDRLGRFRSFFATMFDLDLEYRWEDGGAQLVALTSILYFKRDHADPYEHLHMRGNRCLEWFALHLTRWCGRHGRTDMLNPNVTHADVSHIFQSLPKAAQKKLLQEMFRYTKKSLILVRAKNDYALLKASFFAHIHDAFLQLGASEYRTRLLLLQLRIAIMKSLLTRRLRIAIRQRRRPPLKLPHETIDAWMQVAPHQVPAQERQGWDMSEAA